MLVWSAVCSISASTQQFIAELMLTTKLCKCVVTLTCNVSTLASTPQRRDRVARSLRNAAAFHRGRFKCVFPVSVLVLFRLCTMSSDYKGIRRLAEVGQGQVLWTRLVSYKISTDSKRTWEVLGGKGEPPTAEENELAMAAVMHYMTPDLASRYTHVKSASEMWAGLEVSRSEYQRAMAQVYDDAFALLEVQPRESATAFARRAATDARVLNEVGRTKTEESVVGAIMRGLERC